MKKHLFTLCLLCCLAVTTSFAQDSLKAGVQFKEQVPLSEIVASAQAKGMNVFIDCFTTWCGPCRNMSTKIFPQKMMGDYFNANFLNYKEDMEKTTGLEIAKKFNVRAYPTFLILDKTGKEISRIVGSMSAEEFLQKVKTIMSSGGLSALQARYDKGDRSEAFLFEYVGALGDAYLSDKCTEVTHEIMKGRLDKMLTDEKYRKLFMDYIDSPEDEIFQYALNHQIELEKVMKKDELQGKFDQCWLQHAQSFITKTDTTKVHFDACMKDYEKLMDKLKVANKDEIVNASYLTFSISSKDWKDCITRINKVCQTKDPNDELIYGGIYRLEKNCQDKTLRKEASEILLKRVAYYKQKEEVEKEANEKVFYQQIQKAFTGLANKLTLETTPAK